MTRLRDAVSGDLFRDIPRAAPPTPGTMNFRSELSLLVGTLMTDAGRRDQSLDRWGIAAAMSRLADHDVSKQMLDGYTSEAREAFNLPFWLVPVLETACDTTVLTQWLAAKRGGRVLLGADALDAEIGRLESDVCDSRERLKELRDLRRRVR